MWKGVRFGSCHGRNDDLDVRIRTSVRWNDEKSKLRFDARSHVLAPACSVPSKHDYSCVLSKRSYLLVLIGYTVLCKEQRAGTSSELVSQTKGEPRENSSNGQR
jgi:hypothetical protein